MHNKKMLKTLITTKYTFISTDSKRDSETERVEVATLGEVNVGWPKKYVRLQRSGIDTIKYHT